MKESRDEISLQNLKKIHLSSQGKYTNHGEPENAPMYVLLEILAAFLFILIACINFTNMTTAQSARRAKEIGIRKVVGASNWKIAFQFLGETLLIVFVAHIIAMILVELMLPGLNNILWNNLAY
ncbi:MAG: FtsX-like permease family protein [Bacteroidales bacterium]|nr:FtsX-like permease family protein [Bacteroidales bacterium]